MNAMTVLVGTASPVPRSTRPKATASDSARPAVTNVAATAVSAAPGPASRPLERQLDDVGHAVLVDALDGLPGT